MPAYGRAVVAAEVHDGRSRLGRVVPLAVFGAIVGSAVGLALRSLLQWLVDFGSGSEYWLIPITMLPPVLAGIGARWAARQGGRAVVIAAVAVGVGTIVTSAWLDVWMFFRTERVVSALRAEFESDRPLQASASPQDERAFQKAYAVFLDEMGVVSYYRSHRDNSAILGWVVFGGLLGVVCGGGIAFQPYGGGPWRRIERLRIADFVRTPVWRYETWSCAANDKDFSSVLDGEKLLEYAKPTRFESYPAPEQRAQEADSDDAEDESVYLVRTEFILRDGSRHEGYCSPTDAEDLECLQPVIISRRGQIRLWYGFVPDHDVEARVYEWLGKRRGDVFPIRFRTCVKVDDARIEGKIAGVTIAPGETEV